MPARAGLIDIHNAQRNTSTRSTRLQSQTLWYLL